MTSESGVLYVNAVPCRAGGGVNDLVHTLPRLDERLRALGWETETWVVDAGRRALAAAEYNTQRVHVVDIRTPLHRAIWEVIQFPRVVRRGRPDVVFQFSNFVVRDLPVPQCTVLRSPTFFSDQYARGFRRRGYQAIRYRIGCWCSARTVRLATRAFCISESHREDIVRSLGEIGNRVVTAHLGIDCPPEATCLCGRERAAVLKELPNHLQPAIDPLHSPDRRILLNVAHYYVHKNLGDLLRAVDALSTRHPEIALVLTAGILDYRGPLDDRVRQDMALARKLSEKKVLFDLGPVPKEWVWPLLAVADVFCFPSSLESFGHPLLEAMAMGVPVVAADTPIHREICNDAALFHGVGRAEQIASGIETVFSSNPTRARLRTAGLDRVRQFSWDKHVDILAKAIVEARDRCSPR